MKINIMQGKPMLKKIILTSTLLLGLSSQLSASLCTSYGNNIDASPVESFFYCNLANGGISASASYSSEDGSFVNNTDEQFIGYCTDATDATCNSGRPSNTIEGDWIYVKNTTETDDYFKAKVKFGIMEGFEDIQAHVPDTPPTATPVETETSYRAGEGETVTTVSANDVPGATVTEEDGNKIITAEHTVDGFIYRAIVTTDPEGNTVSVMVQINVSTNEEKTISTQGYLAGTNITIYIDDNGMLVIRTEIETNKLTID